MSQDHYIKIVELLPSPEEIFQEIPLCLETDAFIQASRSTVRNILERKDPRLLVVVGPCSIHHPDSAIEFARRLINLQREIQDSFFLVMRVYIEKSRTTVGWKGLLNDPFLDGTEDILSGIRMGRDLLAQLNELGVPTATEFLDPLSAPYFEDFITWGCIGARTSESQTHRLLASGLRMPIAFKNSTQGCSDIAINGMIAAMKPHRRLGISIDGTICVEQTPGNRDVHIALRGGSQAPNYDFSSITSLRKTLKEHQLPEKIIVDCSHDNSPQHEEEQKEVFSNVIEQTLRGNEAIRGIILESYLHGGRQKFSYDGTIDPKISVTDPCLDWETTAQLLREGAMMLKNHQKHHLQETISCIAG